MRTPNTQCSHCNIPCYQRPYLTRKGMRAFCSQLCHTENRRVSFTETKCLQCRVPVIQKAWQARVRPRKFCSRSCASKSQRGMNYTKTGYRNKQQRRMSILRNAFDFSMCMVEGCTYGKVFNLHRLIRGCDGGQYEIGNMFAICPNHHAEIHAGIVKDVKISDCQLRLESN